MKGDLLENGALFQSVGGFPAAEGRVELQRTWAMGGCWVMPASEAPLPLSRRGYQGMQMAPKPPPERGQGGVALIRRTAVRSSLIEERMEDSRGLVD